MVPREASATLMLTHVEPWTQSIELAWRPELGFFDDRSALLRKLESLELINQFHWSADEVVVKVQEFATLRVGVDGASIYLASPRASADRVRQALQVALDHVKPKGVVMVLARIRHLVPINSTAREAQQLSAASVLGLALSDVRPTDYALMVDGVSDLLKAPFQVEFGVISDEEGAYRFSPGSGRMGGYSEPIPPDLEGLPRCAAFFDWSWVVRKPMTEDGFGFESVVTTWDSLAGESARLAAELWERHMGIAERKEEKG